MPRSAAASYGPPTGTVADYPEFEQKVALVCRGCGKKGKYQVGRIFVDSSRARTEKGQASPIEEYVCFSGLFRCKHCGSGGPWEFPGATQIQLLVLMAKALSDPDASPVTLGRMQMFDGTLVRTGAESEDHLKQRIEERPDDAFLWGRLGNLYDNAGDVARARPAYERAVQLDPGEVEANYTLGCYRMDDGDLTPAADCFGRVVRHARTDSRRNPELLEELVRDSLSRLFDLHCESEGEIPFPPEFDKQPADRADAPAVVHLLNLDLSTDEGWDTLTAIYLTGKVPERVRSREAKRLGLEEAEGAAGRLRPTNRASEPSEGPEASQTLRGSQRVPRNEPCPCGSGKKYKRCCGRA